MPCTQYVLGQLSMRRNTYFGIIPADMQRIIIKYAKDTYKREKVNEAIAFLIESCELGELSYAVILDTVQAWKMNSAIHMLEGNDPRAFWVAAFKSQPKNISRSIISACQGVRGAEYMLDILKQCTKDVDETAIHRMALVYEWDNEDDLVRKYIPQ